MCHENNKKEQTCLGVALFSGLQSGLIPIPVNPILFAGKAQTRTCS